MFHHVDILDRLRDKEKQRNIQAALGVSPKEITAVRTVAELEGWFEPGVTLPSKAGIHAAVEAYKQRKREQRRVAEGKPAQEAPQTSQVEPHREVVTKWVKSGEEAKADHGKDSCKEHTEGGVSPPGAGVARARGDAPATPACGWS